MRKKEVPSLEELAPRTKKKSRRPCILIINYACNPEKGSENAVGWGLLRTVAEFADCLVLTSAESIDAIRRWEAKHQSLAITYLEVSESRLSPYLGWHRIAWFVGYVLWLRKAAKIGTQSIKDRSFDATFHATISTYWLPTTATTFGIPVIWGPVGGAVTTPIRLWPLLGLKGLCDEFLDLVSVRVASWLPATRRMMQKVTIGLLNNEETLAKLPNDLQTRSHIINHVLFLEKPNVACRQRKSHILYFSPLETRKGPRLAFYALSHTPDNVRLRIVGNGPELPLLKRLARKLKVTHRVDFLYQLPRPKALEQVAEAAAVVFTGLREEGGASLAETMLIGTPVVVLANGGAKTVANSYIDSERVVLIEPTNIKLTAQRMGAAMTRFSKNPVARHDPNLDQATARRLLKSVFQSVVMETGKD
jgi:glycosyltransferase involved in cell wall biosynthesis